MIIVAKENISQSYLTLTKNKTYKVLKEIRDIQIDTDIYPIKDDKGETVYVPTKHFITIEEFRNSKINNIIDN